MSDKELTTKQENACLAFIEHGGNQSAAYRQAYNTENMAALSIHQEASRLFALPHIASRVVELEEEHRERHNVTIDTITAELDENRALALGEKQAAAATSATACKAKIHGLITDKSTIDHTSSDGSMTPSVLDVSKLSTETIKELLAARESARS